MKQKEWIVSVDEYVHLRVVFKPNVWTGKHKLIINRKETIVKPTFSQYFVGLDHTFMIGEKKAHFVYFNNLRTADIAIDGYFINSKKPYTPLEAMPKWTWLFILACIAIPIVSLGGALPAVIAWFGAAFCARTSVSPEKSVFSKMVTCLVITISAWGVFFLLAALIGTLLPTLI